MRPASGRICSCFHWHFNPRTPYGMRHRVSVSWSSWTWISIHAPLTGCDIEPKGDLGKTTQISIHAPLTGCDRAYRRQQRHNFRFQSTHPLRDATINVRWLRVIYKISIHAPLTGCDTKKVVEKYGNCISIHAPLTGCDVDGSKGSENVTISIHAPLTGCDFINEPIANYKDISIHAPLTGCDI